MSFVIRPTTLADVPGAVALQALCFPPPFSDDYHWDPEHIQHHIEVFPEGQWIAEADGAIVGNCTNIILSEERWQARAGWEATAGGAYLRNFDPGGTTLYGLDIGVHPDYRRRGIARAFYAARFELVRQRGLTRFGTACRVPGWQAWSRGHNGADQTIYAREVVGGGVQDVTLTPLLRMGLAFLEVIPNYMPDEESGDAGALLEWRP